VIERAFGPRHPSVAKSLVAIANVYHLAGRSEEALELDARALAIQEALLGPNHPDVGLVLRNMAGVHRDRGELELAIPLAERAIQVFARHEGTQESEPRVQFMLAIMLVDTGRDRDRAIALAEQAIIGYRAMHREDKVASAEGWIAEQKAAAAAQGR